MAKTLDKSKKSKSKKSRSSSSSTSKPPSLNPAQLLSQSTELLQQGQPHLAAGPANSALATVRTLHGDASPLTLPALSLLAQIQLELGDSSTASTFLLSAVEIDPEGAMPEAQGGGADKFLWLAQVDETGGEASLKWFEKAVACLERDVAALEQQVASAKKDNPGTRLELAEKRMKLAHALCAQCELWMTDLSFSDAAESACERLVTQAMLLAPEDAQTLQTLGSIRLSQERVGEAQAALERSVDVWKELPETHPLVPEFAVRIALARTLMEAGMEDVALDVCERLVGEDDQSVEAWYLGGWCQHLIAQGGQGEADEEAEMKDGGKEESNSMSVEESKAVLLSSREWLRNCLKLCEMLDYEDDRLRDHAKELVEALDKQLGDAEIDDEDEWEGISSEEEDANDQEMDQS